MEFCPHFLNINCRETKISLNQIMCCHTFNICSHLLLLKVWYECLINVMNNVNSDRKFSPYKSHIKFSALKKQTQNYYIQFNSISQKDRMTHRLVFVAPRKSILVTILTTWSFMRPNRVGWIDSFRHYVTLSILKTGEGSGRVNEREIKWWERKYSS